MIRRPPRSTRTDTSFPTRRSSDLRLGDFGNGLLVLALVAIAGTGQIGRAPGGDAVDRNVSTGKLGSHCLRSEEHTSELQSLMRISYAVFCLKKKRKRMNNNNIKRSNK